MRYNFSSGILKVVPPAASFADAWELLCFDLLKAENPEARYERLLPPDCGIDILSARLGHAFQCKSTEQGGGGSISGASGLQSLETALKVRAHMPWSLYCFASNAPFTGSHRSKILEAAILNGLAASAIEFRGPDYWDDLCTKYPDLARRWLRTLIDVDEPAVVEAFRKARYYDQYVSRFAQAIAQAKSSIVVTNNLTPIELKIPFSPDLTVRHLVDVVRAILGVTREQQSYPDLDTEGAPSASIAVNGVTQPLSKTIGEIASEDGAPLQFRVRIDWGHRKPRSDAADVKLMRYLSTDNFARLRLSESETREMTVSRLREHVQEQIWASAASLLKTSWLQG